MYLLDTNLISEMRKGARADVGVTAFLSEVEDSSLFLSVLSLGEIRRGVDLIRYRGDRDGAARLEIWLESLTSDFSSRLLDFDRDCALIWGRLMVPDKAHPVDKQIAATALLYDLTLVTRNIADIAATPVKRLNPFSSAG
ncbi:MAG: PIN domain-containing protein [Asticcacaulis sp.]